MNETRALELADKAVEEKMSRALNIAFHAWKKMTPPVIFPGVVAIAILAAKIFDKIEDK